MSPEEESDISASEETEELNPFLDAAPVVGARVRQGGGGTVSSKLLGQLIAAHKAKAASGTGAIGLTLEQFCKKLGIKVPSNLNSWRAGLQRAADKSSVEGSTVLFHVKGMEPGTFAPTKYTVVGWETITVADRKAQLQERRDRAAAKAAEENGGNNGDESA